MEMYVEKHNCLRTAGFAELLSWLAEELFLGGRSLKGGSVCSLGGNLSLCYGCGRFSLVAPVCVCAVCV